MSTRAGTDMVWFPQPSQNTRRWKLGDGDAGSRENSCSSGGDCTDRHLESGGARERFVFIAGMRGIDPANDRLVEGEEARIRQAFMNMKFLAESEGASLTDCVRLTVFVTDMSRLSKSRRIFGKAVRAAHHCRGHRAEPGRLFRGGRHLLYTKRPMNLQMPLGWRCFLGYIYL